MSNLALLLYQQVNEGNPGPYDPGAGGTGRSASSDRSGARRPVGERGVVYGGRARR